jgi:hypothetical protein
MALDVTSVDGGDGLIDRARRGMLGLGISVLCAGGR